MTIRETPRPSCRAIEKPPVRFFAGVFELFSGATIEAMVGMFLGSSSGAIVPGPSGDAASGGGGSDATASRMAAVLLGDTPANGVRLHG
jgi:hypothetical protein